MGAGESSIMKRVNFLFGIHNHQPIGNFDFVLELIREIWIDNGIDVTVYEYGE